VVPNVLSVAMKVLKTALIATGVGALVVALGSLVAYFTKSGRGADQFAVIMAKVRSVIDNVISRLAAFGEGIFLITTGRFREGWEKMTAAVKGFGEEIKEDWKLAGELAKREDDLFDRETALVTSLEERRQKVAELRLQAKEQQDDAAKASRMLEEAMALEKSMTADQIALETERLAIMKEKLALQAKDPTDEQLREIAEQEANLSRLRAEGANAVRAMQREYTALTNAVNTAAEAEAKLAEAAEKAWEKVARSPIAVVDLINVEGMAEQLARITQPLNDGISQLTKDLADAVNSSIEGMAVSMGELLGQLALGDAGFKDFGSAAVAALADLAITVGKVAIAAGVAALGIDAALKTPAMGVAAIAAGIALVALGSLVRGALANAATGAGSSSVSAAGAGGSSGGGSTGGSVWDLRTGLSQRQAEEVPVRVTGEFRLHEWDLVAAVEKWDKRRNA